MVVKTLFKTVKREISRGFGRFAAIFAITALGVGFLAGLLSTAPDFYKTIDAYYDNCDFMDINIKSTGGLTSEDLDAVKGEKSVENAALYKTADVIIKDKDGNDSAARIYGCSDSCLNNKSGINKTSLKKGFIPRRGGCGKKCDKIQETWACVRRNQVGDRRHSSVFMPLCRLRRGEFPCDKAAKQRRTASIRIRKKPHENTPQVQSLRGAFLCCQRKRASGISPHGHRRWLPAFRGVRR